MTKQMIIEKYKCGYSIDTIVNDHFRDVNKDYARVIYKDNSWLVNKEYTKKCDVRKYVEDVIFEYIHSMQRKEVKTI